MGKPNPYEPPRYETAKFPEQVPSFLVQVDAVLGGMKKPFFKEEFLFYFKSCRPNDFGFNSLENLLIFRGCSRVGSEFAFCKTTGYALQEMAKITASNLDEFTVSQFKKKFNQLFLATDDYLKSELDKRCSLSLDSLLRCIGGMKVLRSTPGQEKYLLPREFHPVWVDVSPFEIAAEKKEKLTEFQKTGAGVVKSLRRFTKSIFYRKWSEISGGDNLNPARFGFTSFDDLFKTIPGVRAVSRSGEVIKFYYKESDLENERHEDDVDDDEIDDEEEEEPDNEGDSCLEDDQQYPIALKVARTLANPFTENQLIDALASQMTRSDIFRPGKRKIPIFLEMISGIRHVGDGKYEHDGDKNAEVKADESREDEASLTDEEEEDEQSTDGEEDENAKEGEKVGSANREESDESEDDEESSDEDEEESSDGEDDANEKNGENKAANTVGITKAMNNSLYEPPLFPRGEPFTTEIPTFHSRVDYVLRGIKNVFSIDYFEKKFGPVEYDRYGYKSMEHLLVFRGCQREGEDFSYQKISALKAKVVIAATYLVHDTGKDGSSSGFGFSLRGFIRKYKKLFLSTNLNETKCGFSTIKSLFSSIPGLDVVDKTPGSEKYYLRLENRPFSIDSSPDQMKRFQSAQKEVEKKAKHAVFLERAPALARRLNHFTKIEFSIEWRDNSDVFRKLYPSDFGFPYLEDLIESIPEVKVVWRAGEVAKFIFEDPAEKENEEETDEEEEDSESDEDEEDDEEADASAEEQKKRFAEILSVSRTLTNPFTEIELHEALARHYKVGVKNLVRVGKRKVPVFLESIPGIKHVTNGKYEHDGVCEVERAANESEENEESDEDEEEQESSDGKDDGNEKEEESRVVVKGSRPLGDKNIIDIGSSSEDEEKSTVKKKEDLTRSLKLSAKDRIEKSKRRVKSKGSDDSSDDSDGEEGASSDNSPVKYLKEEKEEISATKKRPRAEKSIKYIEIGSDEDDEPMGKKVKKAASPVQKEKVSKKLTRSLKSPAKDRKGESKRKTKPKESDESSSDSDEEGTSSDNSPVKYLKEEKEEDSSATKKRPRSVKSSVYIEIGSDEDDEPIVKKAKRTTSSVKNLSKRLSGVSDSGKVTKEQDEHDRHGENSSTRKIKRISQAAAIPPPIGQAMFEQEPLPQEQLLRIANQVQKILMQQRNFGGAAAQRSIPLIDLESEVKKEENSDLSNPIPFGSGNQVTNNLPSNMNPGIQNIWGHQMPFGMPQYSPHLMYQAGFPGGYGAPVLPGFGLPIQPQTPALVPPPQHNLPLPNNIMDFLGQYMGPALPAALQQGATPLELAKKVLDDVYGNQQKPPPQQ